MRYVFLSSLVLLMALGLFVACNSNEELISQSPSSKPGQAKPGQAKPAQSPAQNPNVATNPSDSARRITAEELHKLWEKNDVLIVDTRNELSFKQSHIKGAILIPANEFSSRSGELPRDKMIATYCTWPAEHTSAGAVLTLNSEGFHNAAALLGGLDAWKKAGYPVEGTTPQ